MSHEPHQSSTAAAENPLLDPRGGRTATQIRAAKKGAVIQALVGAVVGAITLPGVFFVLLWGILDEHFWMLIFAPIIPVLVFWGLDALMNETRWSLLRGLIAGVCVLVGIVLTLLPGINVIGLLGIGAVGGFVGVLLSRIRELVRRPATTR
ncbi:hypothetical protein D9V32_00565 [Mycetocola tolaasinivorans]|uniref:Uncharacterized protein n=1 Tax=Mycetocola tolaasinivorans TaxID=76635 RepID=A0A3L7AEN5_9MICO|nr:hypothetical protein [Mycetocola tolaasinivorans]RLP77862.1 hypothetical protein D9V32_00565 [Mycetocola tolaasinivorans]